MSITEISSSEFLSNLQQDYLSPAFTACGKVAVAAKNVFLGSACAVLGTVLKGAGMVTTSTLPPAVGAIALWVATDSIKYVNSTTYDNESMMRAKVTLMFAVGGAIALASMADNIASAAKDMSSYFYAKADEYFR